VDGLPWYFRARHEEWTFDIAGEMDADPVDVGCGVAGWATSGAYGERFAASYMAPEVAWEIIAACIEVLRRGELPCVGPRGG